MLNLPGYQLLTCIYESACSLIYRGIRLADHQSVVIKILKQDSLTPAELARCKQEHEITRNLNLNGIVQAYCIECHQNILAIIFEDFVGFSLKRLIAEKQLTISEFLQIAILIADSLGNIHAANIIHKDINPSNIIFNPETGKLKIIDFGIATRLTRLNPTLKNPKVLEGTLAYMSPEQTGRMNRCLDYRTDFYSLGVTLYEMLTSQLPFLTKDAMELVHCHIAKQPLNPSQVNPQVPQPVADIVMKLLAKNAEERYQSAWGVQADLVLCLMQLEANGVIEDIIPGENDISDKFQIPQRLYGREQEIETLLSTFEQVAATNQIKKGRRANTAIPYSQTQMMLVTGYSGSGKSALAQEICKPITKKRGYFISGKFDQFQRNIPYAAIVKSFHKLVQQLLTESESTIQQFREKLLTALGTNAQIIIDVIPEIQLILGEQPPVPELGAAESQNRFNLVFQQFIRVFCSESHPLVIFLDDLQWSGSATLKLIELMLMDKDTPYLFLIGAYLNQEVNSNHPLRIMLDNLQKEGAKISQINLEPLGIDCVIQLIADTLHSDSKKVKPLAELVMLKTGGNPFFVKEFLKTLYVENLITFDFDLLSWQWDIAQIEAKDITDNVLELMIDELNKLPEATQYILFLAACMGSSFDLETLAIICQQPPPLVACQLKVALQAGLILPTSELNHELLIPDYKFLHDRVQQAAYALIDNSKKIETHLQIGRLLLKNAQPKILPLEIFKIVDHFNFCINLNLEALLLLNQQERYKIANLNLIASQKAKTTTAYEAAVKYLKSGLKLLTEDSWTTAYNLTLGLYVNLVEASYLNANYNDAETIADIVLQNAKTIVEKVKVYEIKIQLCIAQNQSKLALKTGLQVLELLGVYLPHQPRKLGLWWAKSQTKFNLQQQQISTLQNQPIMAEPDKLAAMKILMNLVAPAYNVNPALLPLIVLTMVDLCIKYGHSPWAAYAYGVYGLILCGSLGDIDSGYRFGQISLIILEQFNAQELRSKVFQVFNSHIRFWKEPLKNTLIPLQETVTIGLEAGDVEYASYAAAEYCIHLFFSGENLESLRKEFSKYSELIKKNKQTFSLQYINIWKQVGCNLSTQTVNSSQLIGEYFNETETLPILINENNSLLIFCVYLAKTLSCYLLKQEDAALHNAKLAEQYKEGSVGLFKFALHNFYYSLVLLSQYPQRDKSEQKEIIKLVEVNQKQMKKWADSAPWNFQHKYELVAAEKARVLKQNWQTVELYERAIQGASSNNYLQEEALAYELAAEFYQAQGIDKIAQFYLQEAYGGYIRWQAMAKVKDLETRYPQLLTNRSITLTPSVDGE